MLYSGCFLLFALVVWILACVCSGRLVVVLGLCVLVVCCYMLCNILYLQLLLWSGGVVELVLLCGCSR